MNKKALGMVLGFCAVVRPALAAGSFALTELEGLAAVRELPPAPLTPPAAAPTGSVVLRMDDQQPARTGAPLCGFSSYAQAERDFDGTEEHRFHAEDLVGRWEQIGIAAVSWDFAAISPRCDRSGVKNADGSAHDTLEFKNETDPDTFAVLSVALSGLGSKETRQDHQWVRWNEPNNWLWIPAAAYTPSSPLPLNAHYNHECRLAVGNHALMICAVRMAVAPESISQVVSGQRRYNREIGMYLKYRRL